MHLWVQVRKVPLRDFLWPKGAGFPIEGSAVSHGTSFGLSAWQKNNCAAPWLFSDEALIIYLATAEQINSQITTPWRRSPTQRLCPLEKMQNAFRWICKTAKPANLYEEHCCVHDRKRTETRRPKISRNLWSVSAPLETDLYHLQGSCFRSGCDWKGKWCKRLFRATYFTWIKDQYLVPVTRFFQIMKCKYEFSIFPTLENC